MNIKIYILTICNLTHEYKNIYILTIRNSTHEYKKIILICLLTPDPTCRML